MMKYTKLKKQIQRRARGLFLYISNAILYKHLTKLSDTEKAESTLHELNGFFREFKSHNDKYFLEESEVDLLTKINQAANTQEIVEDSTINTIIWKMEELGAYLWMFGAVAMPGYDTQFNSDIFTSLNALEQNDLIDYSLVAGEIEKAQIYLWRFDTEHSNALQELTINTSLIIKKKIEEVERVALDIPLKENDLLIFGTSYPHASGDEKKLTRQIALQRASALEWV